MGFDRFLEQVRGMNRASIAAIDPAWRAAKARGRVDRPKMPYKPLLLAAIVELIRAGEQTGPEVYLDASLRSVYSQLLSGLFPDWPNSGDPGQPYRHLVTDGVFQAVAPEGEHARLQALLDVGAAWQPIVRLADCMRLDEAVFTRLVVDEGARLALLAILDAQLQGSGAAGSLLAHRAQGAPPLEPPASIAAEPIREKFIENHLVGRWDQTAFGQRGVALYRNIRGETVGQQFITRVGIIDLLGWQEAAKTWWVIELKKGRPSDSVVGQVSRYLGWVEGRMGRHGERAVGAVVAQEVSTKLEFAVKANPKLSLWKLDAGLRLSQVS